MGTQQSWHGASRGITRFILVLVIARDGRLRLRRRDRSAVRRPGSADPAGAGGVAVVPARATGHATGAPRARARGRGAGGGDAYVRRGAGRGLGRRPADLRAGGRTAAVS